MKRIGPAWPSMPSPESNGGLQPGASCLDRGSIEAEQRVLQAAPLVSRRASARPTCHRPSSELLGTLVLIALGDGVVALVVLLGKGGYTSITLGWGLAVLMGICVAGRVSGAHLNPAVTLALAVFRGFPWSKVPPYMLAQLAGAFAGAALVYVNYMPAFDSFHPGRVKTAGCFT